MTTPDLDILTEAQLENANHSADDVVKMKMERAVDLMAEANSKVGQATEALNQAAKIRDCEHTWGKVSGGSKSSPWISVSCSKCKTFAMIDLV